MDIDCQGTQSDYIEMRDGSSQDSPLMGMFCGNGSNVPAFMQTTQNHLLIRWEKEVLRQKYNSKTFFFLLRFFSNYFASGMGFQIEYSAYSFTCGGNFNNQSGTLSSPLYPNPYPTADCVYLISQPNGTYVNISFLTMDIDCQGTPSDYIEMRDGNSEDSPLMARFCGNGSKVPEFMQTTQNHLRIRWNWVH